MHLTIPVPDGSSGPWAIETFTISQREADIANIQTRHPHMAVRPGTYKRLRCDQNIVMSNTHMEVSTNRHFIEKAKGRIHINGLGLGMVLHAILSKTGPDAVTSVSIYESSEDVIRLVAPTFQNDPRVTITHANCLTAKVPPGHFDYVWHDIWTYMSADNLREMTILKRKYARKTTWQACWMEAWCRDLRDRYSRPRSR